ncbi:SDR family oxidoreductase [Pendulispora rubella]|uniref:SDR family oxidoreductase n=1 Tax=Pendulispora rubella TaxID=2741070 RepID=A0ABZ2L465_9BACT
MTSAAPRPVALVTGGSSGIGRACAIRLGESHEVWLTYHHGQAAAEAVVETILRRGGQARALKLDTGSAESIHAAHAEFVGAQQGRNMPRLDALIANAGTFGDGYRFFIDMEEKEWDAVWAVNAIGVIRVFKAFRELLLPGGTVVNVSTISAPLGAIGYKSHGHYGASKAAADAFFEAIGALYAAQGLRCINLVPGLIDTRMLHDHFAHELDAYRGAIPMQRFGEPEEIARLIARLVSADPKLPIGRIAADGGWLQKGWQRIQAPH